MSKFEYSSNAAQYDLDGRKGRADIKSGIEYALADLGLNEEKLNKALRAGKVKNLFKEVINEVYGDAAFLILEKTNAVYLLHEPDKGDLKVARPTDKLIWRLLIYTCDSMVHADLDSRQETIKRAFLRHGQDIDTFELFSSKLNMRKRFPFKNDAQNLKEGVLNTEKRKVKQKMTQQQKQATMQIVKKIQNKQLRQALTNIVNEN